ncbi:hypothetical protein CYMTET_27200 [Cymbomonas tetramitiformis]|uniref:Uncharacterized protein n=2 Tax=Cymbomonas tetramitiformis TaxID=36881 RepID=A0AAE0KXF3_9CHLO|nr:hypothetical protein CYMTET_27200 [Cymbomonas tetramitiformis]
MEIPVTEREKEITVQYGRRFKVAPQVIACEGWRITVLLSALNSEEIRVCRRPLTGVWDVAENGARAAGSYAITDFALASCDISLVGTACDHSWVEYGLGRELVGLKNCTDEPYTYVFTTVVLRAGCAPLVHLRKFSTPPQPSQEASSSGPRQLVDLSQKAPLSPNPGLVLGPLLQRSLSEQFQTPQADDAVPAFLPTWEALSTSWRSVVEASASCFPGPLSGIWSLSEHGQVNGCDDSSPSTCPALNAQANANTFTAHIGAGRTGRSHTLLHATSMNDLVFELRSSKDPQSPWISVGIGHVVVLAGRPNPMLHLRRGWTTPNPTEAHQLGHVIKDIRYADALIKLEDPSDPTNSMMLQARRTPNSGCGMATIDNRVYDWCNSTCLDSSSMVAAIKLAGRSGTEAGPQVGGCPPVRSMSPTSKR